MDKSLILNDIKRHLNIRFDKEFAVFLEIKTTTLSMWYKRNTYDVELLFKKCDFLNPEWLLTGKGEMLKDMEEVQNVVNEPGENYGPDYKELYFNAKYTIEVQKELIESFRNELILIKELNTKSRAG